MLRSPASEALIWGDDRILLYNESYARVCGSKHPRVFGGPLLDAWLEAREFNGEVFDVCFASEQWLFRDTRFLLDRKGVPVEVWFDLYYGPAVDEHGVVRGVLATVLETTECMRTTQQRERHEIHLEQSNRHLSSDIGFLDTLFRRCSMGRAFTICSMLSTRAVSLITAAVLKSS